MLGRLVVVAAVWFALTTDAAAQVDPAPVALAPPAYNPGQQCQAGNLVAMPGVTPGQWQMALVISVDPAQPGLPCQVHPLGYSVASIFPFASSDLATFFAATEPLGSTLPDAWLVRITQQIAAQQLQQPAPPPLPFPQISPSPAQAQALPPAPGGSGVRPGTYECSALTGGHLSPRLALNLTIVDGQNYRDYQGGAGTYAADGSGLITFVGAALNGQRARYAQPGNPRNPATITYIVSGDTCDLRP